MSAVIVAALLACVVLGTTVVLVRDPLRQAMVAGGYGVALIAAFVVLRAPDVALSAVVVAAAASPLLTLLALSRIELERQTDQRQTDQRQTDQRQTDQRQTDRNRTGRNRTDR